MAPLWVRDIALHAGERIVGRTVGQPGGGVAQHGAEPRAAHVRTQFEARLVRTRVEHPYGAVAGPGHDRLSGHRQAVDGLLLPVRRRERQCGGRRRARRRLDDWTESLRVPEEELSAESPKKRGSPPTEQNGRVDEGAELRVSPSVRQAGRPAVCGRLRKGAEVRARD